MIRVRDLVMRLPGNGQPVTILDGVSLDAFRARVRAWLASHRPARSERIPHDDASLADEFAHLLDWQRKLYAAGFVGLLWPREYGGQGAPPVQQAILNEELARVGAPQLINRVGINNAGPTIITHGTCERPARAHVEKAAAGRRLDGRGLAEIVEAPALHHTIAADGAGVASGVEG